jgi:RIO-like serine/threonine protein kinase
MKSPKLQGVIVENVLLLLCKKELSFNELSLELQKKIPLQDKAFKKHLYHLIDFELVSYSGQRKAYKIEEGGLDLLDRINMEKNTAMLDIEDIVITIEKDFEYNHQA